MIKHEQDFTPDELRQLDRLVDGELGDAERRQLLTTCSSHVPTVGGALRWRFSKRKAGSASYAVFARARKAGGKEKRCRSGGRT